MWQILPVFHESSVVWPSNTQIQRENDLFYEQQQHTYLKKKKRNNNIAFAIKDMFSNKNSTSTINTVEEKYT